MKHLCNRDGFIKALLSLTVLVFIAYSGFQFGIPYYRYSAFKSEVKEITRIGIGDVGKIKRDIYESAQTLKVPIEENDIIVTKKAATVRVQIEWSVNVDIFGLYQKKLDFTIDIEE